MNIKSLFDKVDRKLRRLSSLKAESNLFSSKLAQKDNFMRLRGDVLSMYNTINEHDMTNFITPIWQIYNDKLKKIFLPHPPFDFLRNKIIMGTMFVNEGGKWLAKEIAFLEKMLSPKTLQKLLEEDYTGRPIICNSSYLTSHNSIHHLYHLINFQDKTGVKINKYNSLVEWGGGYGNMAKIVNRMKNEMTYTIIDIPLFSCIQWLYLSSILGTNKVNIITEPKSGILEGKINILPLGLLTEKTLKTDIFIATWSLSESSKFAQNYVNSMDFFGAKHLLFAFQSSSQRLPDASFIGDIVVNRGGRIDAIDFLPGNYYGYF